MEAPRHWRLIESRNLIGDLCLVCHKPTFPPKDICEECDTKDLPFIKKNRGTIYIADKNVTPNIPVPIEQV